MRGTFAGLQAWLPQRMTAVHMIVFVVFMLAHFATDSPRSWVMRVGVSIAMFVFFTALLLHAWVGIRDVVMDYLQPMIVRAPILVIAGFSLLVPDLKESVELRPLPSFPAIRDLVVDMNGFFKQYHSIRPYLITTKPLQRRSASSCRKIMTSLTAYTNVSCVRVARASALRRGGIRTSSSVCLASCRRIVLLSTVGIRLRRNASMI